MVNMKIESKITRKQGKLRQRRLCKLGAHKGPEGLRYQATHQRRCGKPRPWKADSVRTSGIVSNDQLTRLPRSRDLGAARTAIEGRAKDRSPHIRTDRECARNITNRCTRFGMITEHGRKLKKYLTFKFSSLLGHGQWAR